MPIGGFNGSDPSPTLAQFEQYVAAGQIHYFVAGSGMGGGPGGGQSGTGSQISAWVAAHFTQVTIGGSTFYDLTKPLGSHVDLVVHHHARAPERSGHAEPRSSMS